MPPPTRTHTWRHARPCAVPLASAPVLPLPNAPSCRAPAAAALLALFPGLRGLLALLCWAAVDAAGAAWAQLRRRPELLPAEAPLAGPVRQILEAEAALDGATLAYLEHLLPPLPVLLLGLVLREGSELVRPGRGRQLGGCCSLRDAAWGMWVLSH